MVFTRSLNTNESNHVQQETESDKFESAELTVNQFPQNQPAKQFKENRYSLTREKINSVIDEEILELPKECDSFRGSTYPFKPLAVTGKKLLFDNHEYLSIE